MEAIAMHVTAIPIMPMNENIDLNMMYDDCVTSYLAYIGPTTLSDKATDYIRRIMFNQEMNSDDTRLKVTQARLNLARADNDRLSRVLY